MFIGWEIVSGMFLAHAIYRLVYAFKHRLEIDSTEIRSFGISRRQVLGFQEIRRFVLLPGHSVKNLYLIPKSASSRSLKLPLWYEHSPDFIAWARQHFTDTDAVVSQLEAIKMFKRTSTQTSEDQIRNYQSAKRLCKILTAAGSAVVLLGMFWPHPYSWIIGLLLVLPLLCLAAKQRFPAIISLVAGKDNVRPGLAVLMFLAPLTLALRAFEDWNVIAWSSFWLPFALSLAAILALLSSVAREDFSNWILLIVGLAISGLYAFGTTISLNGLLADPPRTTFYPEVLQKRVSPGTHWTTYYLELAPWGDHAQASTVSVNHVVFERALLGGSAAVDEYDGALSILFYLVR